MINEEAWFDKEEGKPIFNGELAANIDGQLPFNNRTSLIEQELKRLYAENVRLREEMVSFQNELQFYKKLFENLPSAVILKDADHRWVYVNSEACRVMGTEAKDLLGKTEADFFSPEDCELFWQYDDIVLQTGNMTENDETLIRIGSLPRHLLTRKSRLIDLNGKKYIIVSFIDVTDKKNLERELIRIREDLTKRVEERAEQLAVINEQLRFEAEIRHEAEQRAWDLADLLPEILYEMDRDGIFTYGNKVSLQKSGYTYDEALGKLSAFKLIHPNYHQKAKEGLQYVLQGNVLKSSPLELVTKSGDIIPVMNYASPIYSNGEVVGVRGILIDFTDIKQTEAELIKAKEKAEESDKLKTAFLANMSHEIRTPLNSILGFAQFLSDESILSSDRKSFIDIIQGSANHLLTIINDIIDIAKIESGQLQLVNRRFNLNKLGHDLQLLFERDKTNKGKEELAICFYPGLPDDAAFLKSDEVRIRQVIVNLLGNALKFTNKGKIDFGYDMINSQDKKYLRFFVHDTGKGIAPAKQSIIFDRFRQEDESHSKLYGGAGLGLSISKGLVDLLGGSIWVESTEGVGSNFFFTIPFISEMYIKEVVTPLPRVKQIDLSGKKILIVEDVDYNYLYLNKVIEPTGALMVHAIDGKVAVDICKENPAPDMIIMDIQLPGISGFEATRQIRQFNKDVPIIAQTAFALSDDKAKCLEAGCNDYIAKPYSRDQLLEKIYRFFK